MDNASLQRALLLATMTLVVGCQPPLQSHLPLCGAPAAVEPIVGGTASNAYPSTVALLTAMSPTCTGTVVGPDVVLTAAHCFVETPYVPTHVGVGQVGAFIEVAPIVQVDVHPSYRGVMGGYDLAVVHLETSLTHAPAARTFLGDPAVFRGQACVAVGYGESYLNAHDSWRRDASVTLDDLTAQTLVQIFRGTGICHGDSGGPLYAELDGGYVQIGVASWGDGSCAGVSYHQRLDVATEWLATHGVPTDSPMPAACDEDGVCDASCATDLDCEPSPPSSPSSCTADGVCNPDCDSSDPDCARAPAPTCDASCVTPDWATATCVYYDGSGVPCAVQPMFCSPFGCRC